MNALRTVGRELLGLFVDDGALAALALLWVGVVAWLVPSPLPPAAGAAALFAGLAAGLAFSVFRA